MTAIESIFFELEIDPKNQWFVPIWVSIGGRNVFVRFKVDTGCNALVLSHRTLNKIGFLTHETNLSKLPPASAKLASGDKHVFRKIGTVSLCHDKKQAIQICTANAVCHSTHETHDLLGTEVLRQFKGVTFNLADNKHMELMR